MGHPLRRTRRRLRRPADQEVLLGEAIKTALGIGRGKHKTLVDRFAYPTGGTGMVYERMAQFVREHGGQVHLRFPGPPRVARGTRVRGLQLADGRMGTFDHVISTMPLTLLVEGLDVLPDDVARAVASLTYRNTILVYLHVDGADLFPDQWLYVHSPELATGRVTNFRNWVPELYGDAKTRSSRSNTGATTRTRSGPNPTPRSPRGPQPKCAPPA